MTLRIGLGEAAPKVEPQPIHKTASRFAPYLWPVIPNNIKHITENT